MKITIRSGSIRLSRSAFFSHSSWTSIEKNLISEEKLVPYIIRVENWTTGGTTTEMRSAYAHDGSYIGDPATAELLWNKYGIIAQRSQPNHTVSSIGFSERLNKWFGWSHRAIYGFKIGDECKPGDLGSDDAVKVFKIKTLDEAKARAIAFAESVSSDKR